MENVSGDPVTDHDSSTRLLVLGMDSNSASIISSLPGLRLLKQFTHTNYGASSAKLYSAESALSVLCVSEHCDIAPDPLFAYEIIDHVMTSCREVLIVSIVNQISEHTASASSLNLITSTNQNLDGLLREITPRSCGDVVRGFSAQLFNYCVSRQIKCNIVDCNNPMDADVAIRLDKLSEFLDNFVGHRVDMRAYSRSVFQEKRPSELLFT